MNVIRQTVAVLAALPLWGFAQGTITVRPETEAYFVSPGGELPITVVIEAADPIRLFSYGIRLDYDPTQFSARVTAPVVVPLPIDFNGVEGSGALVGSGQGWVAVKGTVDISQVPRQAYAGGVLATFNLQSFGGAVGDSSDIRLSFFNTLGASETIFVDAIGEALDHRVTFRSGVITTIPEPSTTVFLLCGLAVIFSIGLGGRLRGHTQNSESGTA